MAKASTIFICQQCGYQSPSYLGKCPNCEAWSSLVETNVSSANSKHRSEGGEISKPIKLSEATTKPIQRLRTGIEELDRVLGGGIVPGSVVLLAGDPGIGKSTLVLQIASLLKSLYVTGEESTAQVKLRYERLGLSKSKKNNNLYVLAETNVDLAIEAARADGYQLLVADSIQTMVSEELQGAAGSVGQVRESAYRLHRLAKRHHIPVFLVGHVTKEGAIAGPKVLEHLVDTVLYLQGEQEGMFRLLVASKNRFGPVDEIGVFEMGEAGMQEVKNPSKKFLEGRVSAPGSIVVPVMEGSRAILTEIQALTNQTNFGLPTRRSLGIDQTRLQLLVATLSKRAGLSLGNQDVFVNIAGGLQVRERGVDLGVCLAIASSVYDKVISKDTIAIGEVGLLGEIRVTPFQEKRATEARRLGFKNFITSQRVKTLREAIRLALSLS